MTKTRKPRIGLLNVTYPTHREAKNEVGDDWVNTKNIEKIRNQLKDNGLDLVEYNKIVGYSYDLWRTKKRHPLFLLVIWHKDIRKFIGN